MNTTPAVEEVRTRLRELSRRLSQPVQSGEPPRPPGAITPKQLSYLVTLLNQPNGRAKYKALKRRLNITAPLGRLSKREAWLIIHHFTRRDSR